MRNKIGIVGGSGFIGSSLARHLSSVFSVKILDIKEPKDKSFDFIFDFCDICDYGEVKKALADVDLVIHTAIIQIPAINEQKKLGYEVNFLGTQNVCKVVYENPRIKGMILSGSWHTMGDKELRGTVDEEFGYRPDEVEDIARLYTLSKIAQAVTVRYYDEMSNKIFGMIGMGTVLGEGMPENTVASIFIERGLTGQSLTPYRHSMYRPMLYVDIDDICKAYESYAEIILNGTVKEPHNSLAHVINIYYPEPITIIELAEIVKDTITKYSAGKLNPDIEVVDKGIPPIFNEKDKEKIKLDISKAKRMLRIDHILSPRESIEKILRNRFVV